MIELIIAILITVGILYATFASNPYSFDDLIELKFLKSRQHEPPTYESLGLNSDDHAGICVRKGQINTPFSNHTCDCEGYVFEKVFFGVPLCKCGDEIQVHGRKRWDQQGEDDQ